jgi:two-component system phosphate regulon sensor histidine kinase PhoR
MLLTLRMLLKKLTGAEPTQSARLKAPDHEQIMHDNRLMALINSVDKALAEVDAEGKITVANTALSELSGSQSELKGMAISSVLPLKHAFKNELKWDEALRAAPVRYRDYFLTRDKRQVDVELSINPIEDKSSVKSGYIIICHDITQDRSLDEQRQEFVAVTSHELRTPVAIIEGSLSVALAKLADKDQEVKALLEQAQRNALFLGKLIQDLTLLAKAQNDNLEIKPQVVDPKILTSQLVQDYAPLAGEKGLALRAEVKGDVPTVLTTESHVEEILRNFISNGIKYTQKGEVVVRAEPAQKGSVLFSVQDSGIGLSQQDQGRLFTRFFRAEGFETRETGGSGLGLYISQEIAVRINAKLWCVSELGKGSTFYLEVPPFSKLAKDQSQVVTAGITNLVDQI